MGFETASFTSVGNRGLNPTISLSRTRRVENPVWNFTLPYTFQGTVAGYTSGGRFSPVGQGEASDVIDKFPFATNANATNIGYLTSGGGAYGTGFPGVAGQSSETHGYSSGGNIFVQSLQNIIDRFSFASDGNATDVGDLTQARAWAAGQQN